MPSRTSNLGALGLATAIALAVSEVALRTFLPAPPLVDLGGMHGADVSITPAETSTRRVSDLYLQTDKGLRLRPNTGMRILNYPVGGRTVEIATDAFGMRRVERAVPPTAPTAVPSTKVLFLGDSVTFGEGVSNSETFVQLLEGSELPGGIRLETYNGGVPGYGLVNELALLEDVGPACGASLHVLVIYLNDAIPSPSVRIYSPPSVLSGSYLVSLLYASVSRIIGRVAPAEGFMPEEALVHAWQREVIAGKGDPSRDLAARNLADWGVSWSDGVWSYLAPLVARFQERSTEMGARSVVVVTPIREQLDPSVLDDFPQRRVRAIAEPLGIPVIDLLPGLQDAARSTRDELFLDHCHFTPEGHEVAAAVLKRELGGLLAPIARPAGSVSNGS